MKCARCQQTTITNPELKFHNKNTQLSYRICTTCNKILLKEYRAKLRQKSLNHYGKEKPKCSCPGCDETRPHFLLIIHQNHKTASDIWLKKNNYPNGPIVICHNCHHTHPCPVHEIEKRTDKQTLAAKIIKAIRSIENGTLTLTQLQNLAQKAPPPPAEPSTTQQEPTFIATDTPISTLEQTIIHKTDTPHSQNG